MLSATTPFAFERFRLGLDAETACMREPFLFEKTTTTGAFIFSLPSLAPFMTLHRPLPVSRQNKRRSKRQRTISTHSGSPTPDGSDSDFVPSSTSTASDPPTPPRRRVRRSPELRNFQLPAVSSKQSLTSTEIDVIRTKLLDWYVDNHRKLPWRAQPAHRKNSAPQKPPPLATLSAAGSPYAVWVSEVMSQQTRLSVVEGYYKRWMSAFPTIHALAEAPLDRVNELWAGLGYYRRARFLHEGAKQVLAEYNGCLPGDIALLLKIRGVGRYTAGAIASIAFGKNVPIVDGNVERVIARLCPGLGDQHGMIQSSRYWEVATELVEGVQCPGDFNQALMELGATVCKPKAVLCGLCPIQDICGAYREAVTVGEDPKEYVVRYPVKDPKKMTKVREERVSVSVVCAEVEDGTRFLVVQRPKDGLLAGLWEAPNAVVDGVRDGRADRAEKKVQSLVWGIMQQSNSTDSNTDGHQASLTGSKPDISVEVGIVTHIFSHIRQTLHVNLVIFRHRAATSGFVLEGTTDDSIPFQWLSEEELERGAVSTQMKKVFAAAKKKLPKVNRIKR